MLLLSILNLLHRIQEFHGGDCSFFRPCANVENLLARKILTLFGTACFYNETLLTLLPDRCWILAANTNGLALIRGRTFDRWPELGWRSSWRLGSLREDGLGAPDKDPHCMVSREKGYVVGTAKVALVCCTR